MKTKIVLVLVMSLTFSSILSISSALADEPLQGLESFVSEAMQDYEVPGAAISVVHAGKLVYLKGFGVRRVGTDQKVNGDTLFRLASVTKSFTAAAVGTMVDKGKISFDEDVINIVPNFALKDPYPTRFTTPTDLLAHRTGLPAFSGDLIGDLGYTREEIVRRIRHFKPAHSFREEAGYSNLGFFLAGEVAANSANSTWETVVRDNLLTPLEMHRTGFAGTNVGKTNVALPHGKIAGRIQVVPPNNQAALGAAGAMISSASDMAHYMLMLLGGGRYRDREVLKPDTVNALFAPNMVDTPGFAEFPPISEKTGFAFGMGWGMYYWKNHKIIEKGGALDGVRSVTVLVPEINLGVTVLANLNLTVLPEAVRAFVLEQYLGEADYDMQAEIKQRSEKLNKMLEPPAAPPKNPQPPSRDLLAYTGSYENEFYGVFRVVMANDELGIKAGPANYPGTLTHWNYETFQLKWPLLLNLPDDLTFVVGPKGNIIEFLTESFGSFKKLP